MAQRWHRVAGLLLVAAGLAQAASANSGSAKKTGAKAIQGETLARYVQRMQQQGPDLLPATAGSLWTDNGRMSNLFSDYKAARVGDVVMIVVSQSLSAQSAGSVGSNRTFSASSSITGLPAHASTSAVQNLFSPNSASALAGKAQAATTSTLSTSLAGRVVALLPSGTLVIEAERQLTMNNERQSVLLRGLVRPGDIGPGNSVLSNNVGNLELEVKGKGVLSDGTRPPNFLVRAVLRLLNF